MTSPPMSLLAVASPPVVPIPHGPLVKFLRNPEETLRHLGHLVAHFAWVVALHVVPPLLATVLVVALATAIFHRLRGRQSASDLTVLEILAPPNVEAKGAEAFWSNAHALLASGRRSWSTPSEAVFEIGVADERVRFRLVAPSTQVGHLARAVAAAWPGATVLPCADTDDAFLQTTLVGRELRLQREQWLPIATDQPLDPLRSVLGAAAELGPDEQAVIQVLVRPASRRRMAKIERSVLGLQGIASPSPVLRVVGPVVRFVLDAVTELITPGPPRGIRSAPQAMSFTHPQLRVAREKVGRPCFEAVVRIGVGVRTTERGIDRFSSQRLRGRARGLAAAFATYAGDNALVAKRLPRAGSVFARRAFRGGDLYSAPEIAALAHLPWDRDVPGVARAGARRVSPPPDTPRGGKILGHAETSVGRSVALAPADATQHLHLIGATGSGKSTLMMNLVLADASAGRGAIVIDPKGDLIVDILERLPEEAVDRVVLIDPEDDEPPALNVLAGGDVNLVVDQVVGVMHRLFSLAWGPRTDDVLRAALLTLRQHRGASLTQVPRLLTDSLYRAPLVAAVSDPVLRGFWRQYDAMSEGARAAVIGPVTNKLRAFLLRPFVRSVIGSGTSSFSLDEVLDVGLLLCRLPKGILGDETVRLMGSLLVAQVWQAAAARARSGRVRLSSSLYLDECQNFLGLPGSIADILAEARAYGLGLVLAHQTLSQLGDDLADAVSANARSKIFFNCSPEDARHLERHVAPELAAHDLSHLGAYQAACRLVVSGEETSAFTMRTEPPPQVVRGRSKLVRDHARENYGLSEAERRALTLVSEGSLGGQSEQGNESRSWAGRSSADSPDDGPDGFNLPGLSRRRSAGGGAQ